MPAGSAEMPASPWGRMTWAVADCKAALSIGGLDEATYFCIGNARLFSGDFEQAIGQFDSALECNSGSGRAYHARALAKDLWKIRRVLIWTMAGRGAWATTIRRDLAESQPDPRPPGNAHPKWALV